MFFRGAGLCGARGTRAHLADDLGAVASRVVDPFALASSVGRLPVHLVAPRVLDAASRDDDAVAGSIGRNYAITDFATVHSPQPRKVLRELAGLSRGAQPLAPIERRAKQVSFALVHATIGGCRDQAIGFTASGGRHGRHVCMWSSEAADQRADGRAGRNARGTGQSAAVPG
jgi:hypothetical protein